MVTGLVTPVTPVQEDIDTWSLTAMMLLYPGPLSSYTTHI